MASYRNIKPSDKVMMKHPSSTAYATKELTISALKNGWIVYINGEEPSVYNDFFEMAKFVADYFGVES